MKSNPCACCSILTDDGWLYCQWCLHGDCEYDHPNPIPDLSPTLARSLLDDYDEDEA